MALSSVLPFLGYLPLTLAVCLAIALTVRVGSRQTIAGISAVFLIAYPLLLTSLQWYTWSREPLSAILLSQPLDQAIPLSFGLEAIRSLFEMPGGYFALYAFNHFWLESILALLVSSILFLLAYMVHRYRQETLSKDEAILLFAVALIAGWPGVLIVIPLVCVVALAHSLYAVLRNGGQTPLTPSLLLGLWGTIVFSNSIIHFFHLGWLFV